MRASSVAAVAAIHALFALSPGAAGAQTSTALDARVQPPELAAPQRGSLAGQLASIVFGPADLARGGFSLPAPFAAPGERGGLLADVFPTYSPDAGMSEWGLGWTTSLAITRSRLLGDLDYATDDLIGPWGRMVRGLDGYWYPVGLSKTVRVAWTGDTLVAYLPDGTQMTFGGVTRVANARGTYSWPLVDVTTVTGRRTNLGWVANASGRLFLSSVSYGGTGADFQYRVDYGYEPLATPFIDYRSGFALTLDQRVKQVTVLARNSSTAAFEKRWHYDLGYQSDALGPAFQLARVQQVFRSGESPQPVVYGYAWAADRLAVAQLANVPGVGPILAALGSDALQPNRSVTIDLDLDGLTDLEHNTDYRLAHQGSGGFTIEALSPAPADVFPRCRRPASISNPPRVLAAMAGDDSTYVVDLLASNLRTTTDLSICNRLGQRLATQALAGDWQPSSTVRLVDLDRDRKPDLVRVFAGQVRVLPNASGGSSFAFGPMRTIALAPVFTPDTAWIHDFNGDGIPDLIARNSSSIVVWLGKGGGDFETSGRTFLVRAATGTTITPLTDYAFAFVDANRDGLTDLVLSRTSGNATSLYVNRGAELREVPVPGLRAVGALLSKPLVASLSGSGDTEITFTQGSQGQSVAIDAPETALMTSADDGKGTVLRFSYARAAPSPGARQRQPILAHLTVESSGYDPVTYDFAYATPRLHSVGKFLLGFDRVTRTDPLLTHVVDFLNEDRYSGVFLGSAKRDALVAGLEQFESRSFDEAVFQGIPWKRLREQTSGWRGTSGGAPPPVTETTATLAWEKDFCPARTQKTTASGTLVTEKHHVDRPAFGLALTCLADSIVETGTHLDTTFDFRHEAFVQRNDKGLAERVETVTGAERLVLQTVGYTPEWRVQAVSSPGKGSSTFDWPVGSHLLRKITLPDGSTVEVVDRDPLTDAIKSLRTSHGTVSHDQSFRFDGQERLQKQWDNLGGATEANPNLLVNAYRYATATTPGSVSASQLVEASGKARDTRDLVTAAGEAITSASRIPEGWSFGSLVSRSRVRGETKGHLRPSVAATTEPALLSHAELLAGASELERRVAGPFGVVTDQARKFHVDVTRTAAESLYLDSAFLLVKNARENGTYDRTWSTDAGGKVLSFSDETRTTWVYRHDALGRLREVILPDGRRHRARIDGHGRVSRVERDDVATVEYLFAPVTGLLHEKRFYPPSGTQTQTRYLSDLAPASQTQTYAPAVMDRSIAGNPITLNGTSYAKGIGAHSESNITYDLSGESCTLFQASVGLDDEATGTCGGVSFEVWGDGKKLHDSGYMVGTTATQVINLGIAGVSQLRLRVTKGTDGSDQCDHGDWAMARVVCAVPSGSVLQMSDLPRAAETYTWAPAVKDRSIAGNPITLDGVAYGKGLGAHSESSITYDLAGKACTLFEADVGVDDEVKAACPGNVTFEVWGDERLLAATGLLDVWKNRQTLAVNVAGRSKVRLRVTLGSDGVNTCDHADWASPRLTCASAPQRSVAYAYDAIGRVKTERHAEGTSTKLFTRHYDGATPANTTQVSTLGFLTGVTGDGFAKTLDYWPDGKVKKQILAVAGWRKVETSFTYTESHEVKQRTTRLLDVLDVPLSTTAEILVYDTYGRLASTTRNGVSFATLSYDGNGILTGVTFPGPTALTLKPDELTRAITRSTLASGGSTAWTEQRMSDRGLVAWEDFSAGGASRHREYRYHPQRFLWTSTDAANGYTYTFDPSGLPATITKGTATKTLIRSGNTLTFGTVTYFLDSLGRTWQRTDSAAPATNLTLTYGADGQVAKATKGGSTWSFLYDEAGQRIAKFAGATPAGTPLEVYAEEGFLDATGLTEPVKVGGRTVGLWKAGVFAPLSTDLRGSVMAEAGALKLASPFGQRDVHPSMARAIDYVEKGFDADLGTVRMGVRDYDPEINRFATADPLFLERPALCGERPVECNLYGYANNAPTLYTDPSGQIVPLLVAAWALFEVGSAIYDGITAVQTLNDPNATTAQKAVAVAGFAGSVLLPGGGYGTAGKKGAQVVEHVVTKGAREVVETAAPKVASELTEKAASKGAAELAERAAPKLLQAGKLADHHVFPQKFRTFFEAKGIDIDQFTVTIGHETTHLKGAHGRGLGDMPGGWNPKWQAWIDANPNATAKDIYQFAGKMLDDFGLSHVPIHPYRQ